MLRQLSRSSYYRLDTLNIQTDRVIEPYMHRANKPLCSLANQDDISM